MKTGLSAFRAKSGLPPEDPWIIRYVSGICADSVRTWSLLNDYGIDLGTEQDEHSLHACFREWVHRYRSFAKKKDLLTDAELGKFLQKEFLDKKLYSKYERDTLFVTLPSQRKPASDQKGCCFVSYAYAAKEAGDKAGHNVDVVQLRARREDEGEELEGIEYRDTNNEFQAAAAWARKVIEDSRTTGPVRIGIVVPDLVNKKTSVTAQFLAGFCPNGHRIWQIPRFKLAEPASISQTQTCAEALLYLRVRHASRVVHSKVKQLSGSDLVSEEDQKALDQALGTDQQVDSSVPSPLEPDRESRRSLAGWMARFSKLIDECRDRFDSADKNDWQRLMKEDGAPTRAYSLADLITMCRNSRDRELGGVLTEILERFQNEQVRTCDLKAKDEELLSRLEEAVARLEDRSVLGRLGEIARELEEWASADPGAEVDFAEAYAYFRTACSMEPAPAVQDAGPVEVLSLRQAFGRSFTHLWITGMRDTEWPPSVRGNPLVPLSTLVQAAPEEFDREEFVQRADEELRTLLHLSMALGNANGLGEATTENVTISYAERDARGDRAYTAAGTPESSVDAGENEEQEGADVGGSHDGEGHSGTSEIAGALVKWHEPTKPVPPERSSFVKYEEFDDGDVRLTPTEKERLEKSRWCEGEFATQFECGFKAFAVHRLGIKPRQKQFGVAYVPERSDEARELCGYLDALAEGTDPKAPPKEEWRNVWKDSKPRKIQDGIYAVTLKDKDKRLLADFLVGTDGGHDSKNLDPKDTPPGGVSRMTKGSYDKFLREERYYPLKVLKCRVDSPDGSIQGATPAYIVGPGQDVAKCFLLEDGNVVWDEVERLIKEQQEAYGHGKTAPNPIEVKSRSGRLQKLCWECHLQTACRFYYAGEPVND